MVFLPALDCDRGNRLANQCSRACQSLEVTRAKDVVAKPPGICDSLVHSCACCNRVAAIRQINHRASKPLAAYSLAGNCWMLAELSRWSVGLARKASQSTPERTPRSVSCPDSVEFSDRVLARTLLAVVCTHYLVLAFSSPRPAVETYTHCRPPHDS